jgi:hypothetical protein
MADILPFPEVMHSRDLDMLHPDMRLKILAVVTELISVENPLRVFEAWRSPRRQHDLFMAKSGVTRADAWQSAHQYGLAVDFARPKGKGWTWTVEQRHWSRLRAVAEMNGLVVPSPGWDPGHVEHPRYLDIARVEAAIRAKS